MNDAALVAMNLLFNAIGSFAVAYGFARLALWLFRVEPGRFEIAFLTLPFAKLVLDLIRGIPNDAFLWETTHGVRQELGLFWVGVGTKGAFLAVTFVLAALAKGHRYPQSGADLLGRLLTRKVGMWAPAVVVSLLLAVACARLVRRAVSAIRFHRFLRRIVASGVVIETRMLGRRRVPILVTSDCQGSPFAAGFLRPHIVFPETVYRRLPLEEREAAIQHELSHLVWWDLGLVAAVGILEDLFWYVPGIHATSRRLCDACEHAADSSAIRRGTPPYVLASALVRVEELRSEQGMSPALSFTRGRPLLARRAARLLGEGGPGPRFGFGHPIVRVVFTAWIAGCALVAHLFGNG